MHATDEQSFGVIFLKLRHLLAPFKADSEQVRELIASYFAILRPWSLSLVSLGADRCAKQMTKFPKPTEWIERIPKAKTAGVLPLAGEELDAYREAAALSFEADPCDCHDCHHAHVSHRFLRYVPDTDDDGRDLTRADGDKVVTLGHWAHGTELAAFYAARDAFMARFAELKPRVMRPLPADLPQE